MPNGTAIGSVSRIVIGCRNDSNCAASTMYMKMNDSEMASTKYGRGAGELHREPPDGAA